MQQRSLFLNILLGCEVVVAIRVLIFSGAILADKMLSAKTAMSLEEWFIVSFSISALFYLVIGILSFGGFRFWRILQYVAILVALVLSGAFLMMVQNSGHAISGAYFVPPALGLLLLVCFVAKKN